MVLKSKRWRNLRRCCSGLGLAAALCLLLIYNATDLPSIHPEGYNEVQRTTEEDLLLQKALTIHVNTGRLGNQMFTFSTLYGIAKLNGRDIALHPDNHAFLSQYFNISFPVINLSTFREQNPWLMTNWLRPIDHHIPNKTNILKGNRYPTSFTFFEHVRQDIRKIFTFSGAVLEHAQNFLRHVRNIRRWTEVFVGVHVRRDDYVKKDKSGWLKAYGGREVDLEYFRRAVHHFRNKYHNITFLAVSDDRKWCREQLAGLGILTVPDSPSALHDLALLTQCNHTIMTYGTFGFWGGYLGGGEVVYFTDFLQPNTNITKRYYLYDKMYPPEWVGISTTKEGYWEKRKRYHLEWKRNQSMKFDLHTDADRTVEIIQDVNDT